MNTVEGSTAASGDDGQPRGAAVLALADFIEAVTTHRAVDDCLVELVGSLEEATPYRFAFLVDADPERGAFLVGPSLDASTERELRALDRSAGWRRALIGNRVLHHDSPTDDSAHDAVDLDAGTRHSTPEIGDATTATGDDATTATGDDVTTATGDDVTAAVWSAMAIQPRGDDALLGCAVILDTESHGASGDSGHLDILEQAADLAGLAIEHDRRLRHLTRRATHDDLTELPNHGSFHRELAARLSRGEPVAVLYLDLNRFKGINDELGHAIGDRVLRAAAGRLAHNVRRDDLIGRLGGDEFAVLFSVDEHPRDAIVLAERMIESLDAPILVEGQRLNIGVSVGIAYTPSPEGDPPLDAEADGDAGGQALAVESPALTAARDLINRADRAMYQAKRTSTSGWSVDSTPTVLRDT